VHGLDARPAAGAGLAGPPVDLERHRQLVRHRGSDHLLVVRERTPEPLLAGRSQALHLVGLEVGGALEGRQARGPEDLVDPRAADAGDRALVAEQRVEVAWLVEQRRELVGRRRGKGVGPERGHRLVVGDRVRVQQLRPGALLGAELAKAQLAVAGEA